MDLRQHFNFSTKSTTSDVLRSTPAFVTAFSDNHFHDGMALFSQLNETLTKESHQIPKLSVYFYDLGIRRSRVKKIQLRYGHFLTIRRFPYEYFPRYVANMKEYRWKPLVIADVLRTHDSVWWMDSSIRIHTLKHLELHYSDLLRCSHRSIENNTCSQYPFTFVWTSGHGIVTATNPGMYDYFPVDIQAAKQTPMMGIGFIIIFATPRIRQEILFWWILCALERDCMSPPGHRLRCDWEDDRMTKYLGCHRYEQAAANALIAIANNYDLSRYTRLSYVGFTVNRLQ